MKIISSSNLIAADRFMDRYGLSCVNNFVNGISKTCMAIYRCFVRRPLEQNSISASRNHYWTYIEQKDAMKCGLGLIPLFGSLLIRAKEKYDDNVAKPETDASLWRNADYAIAMVNYDIDNIENVSMELLYDPEFIVKLLESDAFTSKPSVKNDELNDELDGYGGFDEGENTDNVTKLFHKLEVLGFDKVYLDNCTKLFGEKHFLEMGKLPDDPAPEALPKYVNLKAQAEAEQWYKDCQANPGVWGTLFEVSLDD